MVHFSTRRYLKERKKEVSQNLLSFTRTINKNLAVTWIVPFDRRNGTRSKTRTIYFSWSDDMQQHSEERERERLVRYQATGSRPCPILITSRAADSVQNDKGFCCSLRIAIDKTTEFFSFFLFLFPFIFFFFFSYRVFVFSCALSPLHFLALEPGLSRLACR